MLGTEKQISWVKQIKKDFENNIQKHVDSAKDRFERNTMPIEWFEIAILLQKSMLDTMKKWTAKEFIDNKNFLNFNSMHIKLYKDIQKCEIKKEKMKEKFKEINI